ncbi:hypothetical protein [Streptomyces sp. NPDC006552]|uniref:hypothetical protein n=1 Tax=Streptomyces sp. NPDC006552 TaxID=3157179 RepID=UPI0033AB703C
MPEIEPPAAAQARDDSDGQQGEGEPPTSIRSRSSSTEGGGRLARSRRRLAASFLRLLTRLPGTASSEENEDTPEPPARQRTRAQKEQSIIAWATLLTAALSAIAAIAALSYTGTATTDSHQLAKMQISDSRRALAAQKKEQAVKVNVWTNRELYKKRFGQLGPRFVFVENRSKDPIYMPVIYFSYLDDENKPGRIVFNIPRILPACTKIKLNMRFALRNLSFTRNPKKVEEYTPAAAAGIGFFDASGVAWDRFSGDFNVPPHLKTVKKLPTPKRGESIMTEWVLQEIAMADPKGVTKATGCGD